MSSADVDDVGGQSVDDLMMSVCVGGLACADERSCRTQQKS